MGTCTAIESFRDSLMWDFFHSVYYDHLVFWANNYQRIAYNYTNDSCE